MRVRRYAQLANASLASIGLGGALPIASAAASSTALWVALSGGLAGVALDGSGAVARSLPLPAGCALGGLAYDYALQATYGLLGCAGRPFALASFVDAGAGAPPLVLGAGAVPAPDRAGLSGLMVDAAAYAVVSGGALVVLDLQGNEAGAAPVCEGCLASVVYEPYVF